MAVDVRVGCQSCHQDVQLLKACAGAMAVAATSVAVAVAVPLGAVYGARAVASAVSCLKEVVAWWDTSLDPSTVTPNSVHIAASGEAEYCGRGGVHVAAARERVAGAAVPLPKGGRACGIQLRIAQCGGHYPVAAERARLQLLLSWEAVSLVSLKPVEANAEAALVPLTVLPLSRPS
jgi:hypothetical protein